MDKKFTDTYEPENSEEESLLLNPESLPKRRQVVSEDKQDIAIAKEIEQTSNKHYNTGGAAIIEFETMGRFNIPSILHFNDYTAQDINDLTLSRPEDMLKNLVTILNRSLIESTYKVEDMLLDEILEVLIGMKIEFNSSMHEHPWLCECQYGIDYESQIVNSTEIDLTTLKYRSIQEADIALKNHYKELIEPLSDEDFKNYLSIKYKNEPEVDIDTITKEQEIEKIKIVDPISFKDDNDNTYSFKFIRVKDLLDATQFVQLKYASKFKSIKNKQPNQNVALAEFKSEKDKMLEELQLQQGRDLVLYSKAFSLVKYNGKTLTKDEAVKYYKDMPRKILFKVNRFYDEIKFGVVDERDLECPLCGRSKRRLLRQDFTPFEFLPLESDTIDAKRRTSGLDIFIGV